MQTKPTLRFDDELLRQAKEHARRHGKSLTQMVDDYCRQLEGGAKSIDESLPPRVSSLLGSLSGSGLDEEDYEKHLEKKYL